MNAANAAVKALAPKSLWAASMRSFLTLAWKLGRAGSVMLDTVCRLKTCSYPLFVKIRPQVPEVFRSVVVGAPLLQGTPVSANQTGA